MPANTLILYIQVFCDFWSDLVWFKTELPTQRFSQPTPAKRNPLPPCNKFKPHPPAHARKAVRVPATRGGVRNPRGLTCPSQDSNLHTDPNQQVNFQMILFLSLLSLHFSLTCTVVRWYHSWFQKKPQFLPKENPDF